MFTEISINNNLVLISINNFSPNLTKIDKKSYKNIGIYYTRYIAIKSISDYEIIYIVNPLYLIVGKTDGYIEERNENKYLVFDCMNKNKEVLEK